MSQKDKTLSMLKKKKKVTFMDFPTGFRLSGYIHELRGEGHNIVTTHAPTSSGGRMAVYTLVRSK